MGAPHGQSGMPLFARCKFTMFWSKRVATAAVLLLIAAFPKGGSVGPQDIDAFIVATCRQPVFLVWHSAWCRASTSLFESIVMAAFVAAAVMGFKTSRWIIIAGLAAHGVMDSFHDAVIDNPGLPSWWPAWCMAYDVGASGALALLSRGVHA
jgi:hypothetical protein